MMNRPIDPRILLLMISSVISDGELTTSSSFLHVLKGDDRLVVDKLWSVSHVQHFTEVVRGSGRSCLTRLLSDLTLYTDHASVVIALPEFIFQLFRQNRRSCVRRCEIGRMQEGHAPLLVQWLTHLGATNTRRRSRLGILMPPGRG